MIEIIENLVEEGKYGLKCPYHMNPIGITVHNTANGVSADSEVSYMVNNNNETSYHFCVDEEHAVQGLPLDRNAWHAGDGNGPGNRKTIAVEIARSTSDDESLFDRAEKNAAKLIAYLCKEYAWTTADIYTHQHWSGKYCPHKTLDRGWERFIDMVQKYIDELNEDYGGNDNMGMTRTEAENYVATCYVEYLNRLPDAGAENYIEYLANGGDPEQIDTWIKESDEYNTPYSNDNYKRQYVIKCYDICLGRFPESESVIQEHMQEGRLRDIFYNIYNSEEARSHRGE